MAVTRGTPWAVFGTTTTLSGPATSVAAGDLIFIGVQLSDSTNTPTVSDTAGNTYVVAAASVNDTRIFAWYAYCLSSKASASNVVTWANLASGLGSTAQGVSYNPGGLTWALAAAPVSAAPGFATSASISISGDASGVVALLCGEYYGAVNTFTIGGVTKQAELVGTATTPSAFVADSIAPATTVNITVSDTSQGGGTGRLAMWAGSFKTVTSGPPPTNGLNGGLLLALNSNLRPPVFSGTANTAQVESAAVAARQTNSATATTSQVQSATATAAQTFSATGTSSQVQSSSVTATQTNTATGSTSQVQSGDTSATVADARITTSQVQSSSASATQTNSATGSTSQVQSGAASAVQTFSATGSTNQVQSGSAAATQTISATASSSQVQSTLGSASPTYFASVATSQVQSSSAAATNTANIAAAGTTAQVQSSQVAVTNTANIAATGSTSQVQSSQVAATNTANISATGSTSQVESASASSTLTFSATANSSQVQSGYGYQTPPPVTATASSAQVQSARAAATSSVQSAVDTSAGIAGHNSIPVVVDLRTRQQNQVILQTIIAAITQGVL